MFEILVEGKNGLRQSFTASTIEKAKEIKENLEKSGFKIVHVKAIQHYNKLEKENADD